MLKCWIAPEVDESREPNGRFELIFGDSEDDEGSVWGTFDTEAEAQAAQVKLQAEYVRDDKIEAEYLEWEKGCLERHSINQDELREYLVNVVLP